MGALGVSGRVIPAHPALTPVNKRLVLNYTGSGYSHYS